MNTKYINSEALENFPFEKFHKAWPFPWNQFDNFLHRDAFNILCEEFPPLDLFDYMEGYPRPGGQRSHNRYYLAYEKSIYTGKGTVEEGLKGTVLHDHLPLPWQEFIHEIQTSQLYRETILKALECDDFEFRFNWHVGRKSNEVSPHRDEHLKLGTHLCYFNKSEEWDLTWGGELEILGNKTTTKSNPDFSDFLISIPIQITDNHSLLFKNSPDSWHGVRPLNCPEGKFRRLFNIIVNQHKKS